MSALDELAQAFCDDAGFQHPTDEDMDRFRHRARVALSHLAGKGGITDEQILASCVGTPAEKEAKTRALLAQQAAVDAARIAELEYETEAAEEQIESLWTDAKRIGSERDAALARVAELEKYERAATDQQVTISEMDVEIERLEAQVAAKDAEITELESYLAR